MQISKHELHKYESSIFIAHNFKITFFVNLSVLISMNEAVIALKYDCFVLNVTRPDPIGYLYLSVSIPKIMNMIFINIF